MWLFVSLRVFMYGPAQIDCGNVHCFRKSFCIDEQVAFPIIQVFSWLRFFFGNVLSHSSLQLSPLSKHVLKSFGPCQYWETQFERTGHRFKVNESPLLSTDEILHINRAVANKSRRKAMQLRQDMFDVVRICQFVVMKLTSIILIISATCHNR